MQKRGNRMRTTTTRAECALKFQFNRPDAPAVALILKRYGSTLPGLVIRLAWQLGLQRSEIRALRWEQIDFARSCVSVPGRTIPLRPETQIALQDLWVSRRMSGDWVVLTDRGARRPTEQYLSNACRRVLDEYGQKDVRLADLRYDFVARELLSQDWQTVSRISGLEPRTLKLHFSEEWNRRRTDAPAPQSAPSLGRALSSILKDGDYTACGVALRLIGCLGLYQKELRSLRWDMLDDSAGRLALPDRTLDVPPELLAYLRELRRRNGPLSEYVLISDRARRPIEPACLSRMIRTVLIRAGCDNITLRDLRSECVFRAGFAEPVLRSLESRHGLMKSDAAALLNISDSKAAEGLRRMAESGQLIRSGHYYYAAGTIVPPDMQADAVLAYLSQHGACRRGQLAELLHLEPRQVLPLLERLLREERISRDGTRYSLPSQLRLLPANPGEPEPESAHSEAM